MTVTPPVAASARGNALAAAFVGRCGVSAIAASWLATWLGLGHPVWAVVSALVVSQESLVQTRRSLASRAIGTGIGAAVAVALGLALGIDAATRHGTLMAAIMVCAVIARRWPNVRVCLWTAPIVLMTVEPARGLLPSAIERGSEVMLGAACAALVHLILDRAVARLHDHIHHLSPGGGS